MSKPMLSSAISVARNMVFDARLALYHKKQRWLAVADLHYGYEKSARAAGGLFPSWGMAEIENRLHALLDTYRPETLLLLGDHIHTSASADFFLRWTEILRTKVAALILVRGNHDHALARRNVTMPDQHRIGRFLFAHGHQESDYKRADHLVMGHLHPAVVLSDQAGFRQKIPALARQGQVWILPAFSPWAGGGAIKEPDQASFWLASGGKVFKAPPARKPAKSA